MNLLTEEIKARLPAIGSLDGKDPKTVPIIVKFFSPFTGWTWYVIEGSKTKDDYEFFGLVRGFEAELGYFYLSELDIKQDGIQVVERDLYFGDHTLAEALEWASNDKGTQVIKHNIEIIP
jgi:hypothetical protein